MAISPAVLGPDRDRRRVLPLRGLDLRPHRVDVPLLLGCQGAWPLAAWCHSDGTPAVKDRTWLVRQPFASQIASCVCDQRRGMACELLIGPSCATSPSRHFRA